MLCSPNGNRGSSTHIQTGQTIPTEDMFATFTHHLGTAFILFDGHRTHGTTLDEVIIEWYTNIVLTIGCQTTTVLLASNIRMPLPRRSKDITRMDKRKTNAVLKLEEVGYTYLFKGYLYGFFSYIPFSCRRNRIHPYTKGTARHTIVEEW